MIKIYSIKYLLLLSIIFSSVNASAVTCNEESPNHIKEGDKYYDLNKTPELTRKQINIIKSFISSFKGKRLKGDSVITECTVPEKDSRKIISQETLKAEISIQSDGQLVINLDVYNSSKKSSYNETLKFFEKNISYTIKNLTKDEIHLVVKTWCQNL